MSNFDKYKEIFGSAFQYEGDVTKLKYQEIPDWDSVGHMQLIALIEDAFDIEMDIDDIIDLSSFDKGVEILSKYSIALDRA
jgi:acyl carrier protein